jgi:hypothetical protein
VKAVCGKTARTVWAADGGQRGSDVAHLLRPDRHASAEGPNGPRKGLMGAASKRRDS